MHALPFDVAIIGAGLAVSILENSCTGDTIAQLSD